MVWLIFAVIVGLAGLVALAIRRIEDGGSTINLIPWGVGLLVFAALLAIPSTVRSVGPGEIGIQVLLGKVQPQVLESGVHFVNPLMGVTKQTVRSQTYGVGGDVDKNKTDFQDGPIVLRTSDKADLPMDGTFRFRLDPNSAGTVFTKIGVNYFDKVIRPATRSVTRDESQAFTVDVLSSEGGRQSFSLAVFTNLESVLSASGIILEDVSIRNIKLPDEVRSAVELKLQAEQEAQAQEFVLEKVTAQAEQKREEAKGIRDAQDIISGTLSPAYIEFLKVQALQEIARGQNNLVFFTDSSSSFTQPPVQTVLDLSGLLSNGSVITNGVVAESTSVTVGSEDGS